VRDSKTATWVHQHQRVSLELQLTQKTK
jgi:hypothetical protein